VLPEGNEILASITSSHHRMVLKAPIVISEVYLPRI